MPTALPENVQASDPGHINHTNTMHEARNRIVSVGRMVMYVDGTNGNDSNDGLSLAYPKQTLAAALGAVSHGWEIRVMAGVYDFTTGVVSTGVRSLRLLGAGGIAHNSDRATTFRAQTNGMTLLQFGIDDGSVFTEGPEISNINFKDNTGNTARLLFILNMNRWEANRLAFSNADVGFDVSAGGQVGDNAWNTTYHCNYYNCNTGFHHRSGAAGMQDFGSTFVNCNTWSMNIEGQSMKMFGTFVDNCGVRFAHNHATVIGAKFENTGATPAAVQIEGDGTFLEGNHNRVIGCSFSGGATPPSTAWIHVQAGARNTVLIGNSRVQGPQLLLDEGEDTLTLHAQAMETYSESNVSTDRSFDANSTTLDELADVVGTLIGDLRDIGLVR